MHHLWLPREWMVNLFLEFHPERLFVWVATTGILPTIPPPLSNPRSLYPMSLWSSCSLTKVFSWLLFCAHDATHCACHRSYCVGWVMQVLLNSLSCKVTPTSKDGVWPHCWALWLHITWSASYTTHNTTLWPINNFLWLLQSPLQE